MKRFYIIILVLLLGTLNSYSQTFVPDDGFEQILIDLGLDSGPLDNFVPTANIMGVTNLSIQSILGFDPDVNDFTGIEDFAALTNFTANFVTAPSINLSSNTALVSVNIVGRFLTDVNLKNGNNTIITNFNVLSANGSGLAPIRICVDDIAYANANLQNIYFTGNYFVEDCTASVNSITGTTYFDADNNGCDPSEIVSTEGHMVSTGSGASNYVFTFYPFQENYATYSLDPNVTISLQGIPSYFTVTPVPVAPATSENFIYGNGNTGNQDVVDYCITALGVVNDLQVESYAVSASKPGFQTRIRIKYRNTGNTTISGGAVTLNFNDSKEVFSNADDTSNGTSVDFPPAVTPNTLTWNYTNIAPFETRYIDVYFTINTPTDPLNPVFGGDMMAYTTAITPVAGDATPANNAHSFNDLVVNAYDPNDVTCFEGDKISLAQVPDNLTYRVRFQNTGSAAATNILVSNDIDLDLDISTFQPIASSHPHTTTITSATEIKFTFLNINLPDSTSDEPGSNGWILYKMKPKSTAVIGDVFENTANIFFDYNAPVVTNTAITTVAATTSVPDDNFENYLETHDASGALVTLGAGTSMGNGIANDDLVFTCNIDIITFLDVSAVGNIADLMGIEAFAALDTLICEANQLITLDLSQNSMLTGLFANANQLTELNVQNGNNMNVTSFMANNNPNLNCIQVDDVGYSNANWTNIDAQSSFSASCNAISGVVSYDCTSAMPQQNVQVKATATGSGNTYYTTTNSLGEYAFNINETGSILLETAAPNLMATPANYTVTYLGQAIDGQNFCVDSATSGDDVNITLVPLTPAPRPGFASLYRIYYGNYGSTILSGDIKLTYEDAKIGSVTSPDSFTQNGNVLTWNYTNLAPFEIRTIDVILNVNPATGPNAVVAGDYLRNTVLINPFVGDIFTLDNTFETFEEVVNGYDPNDVTIFEGPYIQPSQSSDFLNFRIRFQNTGNASAINIDVKTTLDTFLDLSTFTPLASSHTVNTSVLNQNEVAFSFPNINLDYESNNEPASHGWVTFKIKPIAGFSIGDIVNSQASIFFDTNPPIPTNTATVQIAPPILSFVPDDNFEHYLETHDANGDVVSVGDFASMGNGVDYDDYVTTANINTVTDLDIHSLNIAYLTGIENFAALEELYCDDNQLTSLDVTQNTVLTVLKCFVNQLTSLDISQNSALEQLVCNDNQLAILDTSQNSLLEQLSCVRNQLTTIDVSQNVSLVQLNCSSNQLTGLNVNQNTFLTQLYFNDNQITTVDLNQNTALTQLKFTNNQISSIDLSLHPNLLDLECGNNILSSLEVSQNPALIVLWCDNNQLTSLNVKNGNNTNLTQYKSQGNPNLLCIEVDDAAYSAANWFNIDPASSFSTDCTDADGDGFSVIDDCDDTNAAINPGATEVCDGIDNNCDGVIDETGDLFYVDNDNDGFGDGTIPQVPGCGLAGNGYSTIDGDCDDNNDTVFPGAPEVFDGLDNNCDGQIDEGLTFVPDDNFELRLIELGFDAGALDDHVTTASIASLLTIDLEDQGIANLTGIQDFIALQTLYCHTNLLTSIDVSANVNLVTLVCNGNMLTSLDVTQNPNLTQLSAGSNQLSSIAINPSSVLSELYILDNVFTSFDASIFTSLTDFRAQDNQLTSLNMQNGNNVSIINYNSLNNPSLTCIFVDDASWSTTNWTQVDVTSTFVNNQADCDVLGTNYLDFTTIKLFPNPAASTIQISGLLSLEKYTLYNTIGVQVLEGEAQDDTLIDVKSLASGLYFLKFDRGNILRFVKE